MLALPGNARLEAGAWQVSWVELPVVHGMVSPLIVAVVSAVKPVPLSVSVAAVLIGPAFG